MLNPRTVLQPRFRPRVFTSQERFIDALRTEVLTSGLTYQQLALKAGVAHSTIQRLASGRTKWPRHTTLFPLIAACGKGLALINVDGGTR